MKQILRALRDLHTIEPLIALKTFTVADSGYDYGNSLIVTAVEGRQELAEIGANRQALLVCYPGGDTLKLEPHVAPSEMPPALIGWLRLLGMVRKGPVATGAPIDIEEFSARVDSLHHAYSVLHFAAEVREDPVDLAHALLTHASNLRATRSAAFEAENTASTTAVRLAVLHQRSEAARAEAKAFAQGLRTELSFRLEDDPRGSTLVVTASNSKRSLYICGVNLSWEVPDALDWKLPRKAGGVKRARAVSATSEGPPNSTAVDDRITLALQTAVANGRDLSITEQLDARTYQKVKALLASLGGRWVRQRQVHEFDRCAEEVLAQIRGGSVVTDRDWEFFPTPEPIVKRMLALAGDKLQPGAKVGEPEAGRGAIALAAAGIVGKEAVDCTEAMPRNAQVLRDFGFKVHEGDFLQRTPEPLYDVVLQNPPFSGHQDAAHITHALAFLKPGGVLVACASSSWRHARVAKAEAFRGLLARMKADVEDVQAGAFRESGTDVATVLIRIHAPESAAHITAEAAKVDPAERLKPTPRARRAQTDPSQLALSLFDA